MLLPGTVVKKSILSKHKIVISDITAYIQLLVLVHCYKKCDDKTIVYRISKIFKTILVYDKCQLYVGSRRVVQTYYKCCFACQNYSLHLFDSRKI